MTQVDREHKGLLDDDLIRELSLLFCDASSLARFSRASRKALDSAGVVASRRFKLDTGEDEALLTNAVARRLSKSALHMQLAHTAIAAIGHSELRAEQHQHQGTLEVMGHAIISSKKGWSVYTCGNGRSGQRGVRSVSDSSELQRIPSDLLDEEPAVCVAAGGKFSVLVVGAGVAYGCGDGSTGALGSACAPCSSCTSPRRIPELARRRVRLAVCGAQHTLFVCNEQHTLLAAGQNDNGELGTGDRISRKVPAPVVANGMPLCGVVAVAAGVNHTLCVTTDGAMYTWGAAKKGQLGHADRHARLTASRVVQGSVAETRIVRVAAGDALSLALDSDGRLHSCGDPRSGSLGYGPSTRAHPFAKLFRQLDQGQIATARVTSVAAGYGHAACVAQDGTLFTWGGCYAGHASALGRGELFAGCIQPEAVQIDGFAIHVAAGGTAEPNTSTTLVLLRDGTVLSAGGSRFVPGHYGRFAQLLSVERAQQDELASKEARRSSAASAKAYYFAGIF